MLNEASRALYVATDNLLFFKEVILVAPQTWRDSRCQMQLQTPKGALVYQVSCNIIGQICFRKCQQGVPNAVPCKKANNFKADKPWEI